MGIRLTPSNHFCSNLYFDDMYIKDVLEQLFMELLGNFFPEVPTDDIEGKIKRIHEKYVQNPLILCESNYSKEIIKAVLFYDKLKKLL